MDWATALALFVPGALPTVCDASHCTTVAIAADFGGSAIVSRFGGRQFREEEAAGLTWVAPWW